MKRTMSASLAALVLWCAATLVLCPTHARAQGSANTVATVPLYRDMKTGEYSLVPKERTGDHLSSGSSIVGYVLKDAIPNATPIYKLVNKGIKVFYSDGTTGYGTVYTTSRELAERLATEGLTVKDFDGKDYKYEYTLEGILCYIVGKQVAESQPLYSSKPNDDGTVSHLWGASAGGGGGIFGPTIPDFKKMFGAKDPPVIGYFWKNQSDVPRMALLSEIQATPGAAVNPGVIKVNPVNNGAVRRPRP